LRNALKRLIAAEIRRLEIRGVPMEGMDNKSWLLMLDPQHAQNMPSGLTPKQRAEWVAKSIRTPEQVSELELSRWRGKIEMAGTKISSPFTFGAAIGLLQFAAMTKLWEDVDKSMAHEKPENLARLRAGMTALAGTMGEVMGMAAAKLPMGWLSKGQAISLRLVGRFLERAGKALGLGAALVVAGFDWVRSNKELAEGNVGIAWAYRASAGLGVAAAIAFIAGWAGIGILLAVLFIAITVAIELYKDNKLQDWLERCLWGKLAAERYSDVETEMKELKIAAQP